MDVVNLIITVDIGTVVHIEDMNIVIHIFIHAHISIHTFHGINKEQ